MRKTATVYTSLTLPKVDKRKLGVVRLTPEPISPDELENFSTDILLVGSDVQDSYALFRDHVPNYLTVVDLHDNANPANWLFYWNAYWRSRNPELASRFSVSCPYAITHAEDGGITAPDHSQRLSKALSALVVSARKL